MTKVKVCIACIGGIHQELAYGLDGLKKEVPLELQYGRARYPDEARNVLIDNRISKDMHRKLDPKYSHFLILDHAVQFAAPVILSMLEADLDIIALTVPHPIRKDSYTCGQWENEQPGLIGEWVPVGVPLGPHPVDWISDHGILAKREALEAMMYPWFHSECIYDVSGGVTVTQPDIGFSMRAGAASIQLHAYIPTDYSVRYHWLPQGITKVTQDLDFSEVDTTPGVSGTNG